MKLKAIAIALLGLLALGGSVGYSYLKPAPVASAPIQSVAVAQAATAASSATVYQIVPDQSQARFVVDEVLRGAPKTVVGSTDQVAGQIAADPTNLGSAQAGTILIDARTFVTDSGQRDRAIQNQVLKTAENEYIVFKPTGLVGLPIDATQGQAVPLQVVGDLTIAGVTQPVTFDATVTPASGNRLQGAASTTIRYADWGISIPQVPVVASVADTVRLELDFTANQA